MSEMVELYHFVQNGTDYFYTSGNEEQSYNGDTYTPETIGRGEIEQGDDINRENLSINLDRENALALSLISSMQHYQVSLTVYAQEDGSTSVIWKGRVLTAQAAGSEITLDCEAVFTSIRRAGLRARYQKLCRHALYSGACGLTDTDWDASGTASAVDGFDVTVSEASAEDDGYYNGGILEYDSIKMYIRKHSGTTLTLMSPIQSLNDAIDASGSASVTIYAGCPHNPTVCESRFSNIVNYGGFPWLPGASNNPFRLSSIV